MPAPARAPRGELTQRQRDEQLRMELLAERSSFEAHWQELASFLKPRRTRFMVSDKNKGDRRNKDIIDSTPLYALRTLQSGLHAGLTSPARPWLRLTLSDAELAEHAPVKHWLHTVTSRMLTVFQRSNIYNVLPTLYGDMGGFATGSMGVLEDDKDLLRCYSYPLGSYAVGLDARGIATTFVRDDSLTVRQLVEQFGASGFPLQRGQEIDWRYFSQSVKNLWDRGNYETSIEVSWIVAPNDHADPRKLAAKFLPWRSCYFERGQEREGVYLRESGFQEFPVLVPRWDVTGSDIYGTECPGMIALGDTKGLQLLHRRKAKAMDKALDPPMQGPSTLKTQKVSLLPGDLTYIDDGGRAEGGLRPVHEVRLEGLQYVISDIGEYQYRIQRAFHEDLFLMLAMGDRQRGSQPVTAREIEERHEEKLIMLGPTLERTNDELLDPLVDRVFAVMLRAGAIPEPPEDIAGQDLKVEYISLLSQAQKLVGIVGQERYVQTAMGMAEVWPEVRHKVNVFQVLDDAANMLGVNPKINRTDDEAQAALEAEQEAAAGAAQAEQMKTQAQAAQALGNTPMQSGTALQAVLDGTGA